MNDFELLIKKLCEPFPKDVHKPRYDGQGTYIPIKHYIDRLNHVAAAEWSHERVGEPIFYKEDQFAHTVVKVTIMGRSHMGEGFSKYQVDDKGRIINRHYAIRSATKDGIRDAISFFGIGKDQGAAIKSISGQIEGMKVVDHPSESDTCIKCGRVLTVSEKELLQSHKVKLTYCKDHIPSHFLRLFN